ncbi:phage holin, lambda family [Pseudomonas sp.]|uniref:phage holin, lambda family n=1 Tax=Pseudomonas sp. TaxID=306 RepID=UPI0019EA8DDA|nr:phage holin, lambda family [Pseudomonas sp.]MBF0675577.1 phage holin, lambda family [Pseudomonas sp.]
MKMPDRPDTWTAFFAWLQMNAPSLYAFGLSATIAILRVVYGGGTQRQMLLEGLLCGLLTLALVPLVEYFGLPQSMATFMGGACGFLGVEKMRDLAGKFGERKAGM